MNKWIIILLVIILSERISDLVMMCIICLSRLFLDWIDTYSDVLMKDLSSWVGVGYGLST